MKKTILLLLALSLCFTASAQDDKEIQKLKAIAQMKTFKAMMLKQDSLRGIQYLEQLPEVPLDIDKMVLASGALKQVPEKVFALSKLERLELQKNQLTSVDKRLTKLRFLKHLDLSGNKLKSDQIRFKKNKSIEYLDLSGNDLTEIPKKIKKLKSLRKIKLNDNQIDDFRILRKLKNLEDVNMSGNEISLNEKTFKKGFGKLEFLTLQKCGLESLPENIGNLQSLKKLYVPRIKFPLCQKALGKWIVY